MAAARLRQDHGSEAARPSIGMGVPPGPPTAAPAAVRAAQGERKRPNPAGAMPPASSSAASYRDERQHGDGGRDSERERVHTEHALPLHRWPGGRRAGQQGAIGGRHAHGDLSASLRP